MVEKSHVLVKEGHYIAILWIIFFLLSIKYYSGDVAYIEDSMGYHKIGAYEDSISLHLYAPPFDRCSVWLDQKDANKVMKPVITFYSEYGQKVSY